jgi:hypothetical protein
MSQYSLQAEDIATVGQIPFGEGVTTSMRRASDPGDTGAAGESPHHLLDTASGQRQAVITQKEPGYIVSKRFGSVAINIFPKRSLDDGTYGDDSFLSPFTLPDNDVAFRKIDIMQLYAD